MKTTLTISHRRGDASHRVWAKRTAGERVAMILHRAAPVVAGNPYLWGAAIALAVSQIASIIFLGG